MINLIDWIHIPVVLWGTWSWHYIILNYASLIVRPHGHYIKKHHKKCLNPPFRFLYTYCIKIL